MGWGGAGGGGAATIGTFYFFGGVLQLLGCILEWIIGNTFPFVVFGSFGKSRSHVRENVRILEC
jgi:succinate-acetate transporter protein